MSMSKSEASALNSPLCRLSVPESCAAPPAQRPEHSWKSSTRSWMSRLPTTSSTSTPLGPTRSRSMNTPPQPSTSISEPSRWVMRSERSRLPAVLGRQPLESFVVRDELQVFLAPQGVVRGDVEREARGVGLQRALHGAAREGQARVAHREVAVLEQEGQRALAHGKGSSFGCEARLAQLALRAGGVRVVGQQREIEVQHAAGLQSYAPGSPRRAAGTARTPARCCMPLHLHLVQAAGREAQRRAAAVAARLHLDHHHVGRVG
jgi:hypothetical protein